MKLHSRAPTPTPVPSTTYAPHKEEVLLRATSPCLDRAPRRHGWRERASRHTRISTHARQRQCDGRSRAITRAQITRAQSRASKRPCTAPRRVRCPPPAPAAQRAVRSAQPLPPPPPQRGAACGGPTRRMTQLLHGVEARVATRRMTRLLHGVEARVDSAVVAHVEEFGGRSLHHVTRAVRAVLGARLQDFEPRVESGNVVDR